MRGAGLRSGRCYGLAWSNAGSSFSVKAKSLSVLVLFLIYAAFTSLGLPDGILGAAWPQMRAEFGVDLSANWPILLLGTSGGLLSSFLSGLGLRYLGVGRVLIVTTFLTAVVVFGFALSPWFALLAGLAFFLGMGNGAIDAGLNHFVANHLSSRHMNWLHAFWGVGISFGTLIVSGVLALEGSWRVAYASVAALQLSLAIAFSFGLRSLSVVQVPESSGGGRVEPPAFLSTFTLPASWASMGAFFVYCGIECGTGLWVASVLHDGRGWSMEASGLMVTLFWSSLTIGRFLMGAVSQWTTPARIVRAATWGVLFGTSLIAASALAGKNVMAGVLTAVGLLLTGSSLAPIFPMLMHDTPRVVGRGHSLNLIGFQSGSAQLGYTVVPIGIGVVLRLYSTEWLGTLLAGLSIVLLGLLVVRERAGRVSELGRR
jgi:fucose permease